jgi:hypothetical protein
MTSLSAMSQKGHFSYGMCARILEFPAWQSKPSLCTMRFWWVNQNQTFRQEIGGGVLRERTCDPKFRPLGVSPY